ncbi:hypothetical protein ZWY2020_017075 [Hordeum vulgare]|nr:hypothetical protein ZWY2020_017075 [Hordeum vulgare]
MPMPGLVDRASLLLLLGPGAIAGSTSQQQVVAGVAREKISMVSGGTAAVAVESGVGSSSGVGVGREETKGKGSARELGSRKASRRGDGTIPASRRRARPQDASPVRRTDQGRSRWLSWTPPSHGA